MSETAVLTSTKVRTQPQPRPKLPRLWNVVLVDDDDHTYEYVIEMMQVLFGHSLERAFEIAKTVDKQGRAICLTTHRELGELKIEQIGGFGRDPYMKKSSGPMNALLEPAAGEDDNHDPRS